MTMNKVRSVAKTEARKAVKGHEASMHGAKKMKKGGVTSLEMKKYGRNLARAMNQRSSSRGR
jgi:hypothetical protein